MHGLHKCKDFVASFPGSPLALTKNKNGFYFSSEKGESLGTRLRTSCNLQIEELINGLTLSCTQRSTRHKNCRIGGLMFDSIYLKFNSKQFSTRDIAKEILHLFKPLSLEKDSTSRQVCITSLAKFGNCCSMVWVHRQRPS